MALQYGVPLQVLCDKFSHTRFEPSGFTGNPDIPIAKSITDYLFRWLALKFLPSEDGAADAGRTARASAGGAAARAAQQIVEAKPPAPATRRTGPQRAAVRQTADRRTALPHLRLASRCGTAPATSA